MTRQYLYGVYDSLSKGFHINQDTKKRLGFRTLMEAMAEIDRIYNEQGKNARCLIAKKFEANSDELPTPLQEQEKGGV